MLESYNLETKHYVILTVLGVVEFILFALMFYNCFLELRQKRRQRTYHYKTGDKRKEEEDAEKGEEKPTLMEIFSVDMTLKRDQLEDKIFQPLNESRRIRAGSKSNYSKYPYRTVNCEGHGRQGRNSL